jgi:hypothetical protein
MDEDLVNGEKKPCPLPLVMGLHDSLDATKTKAKKSTAADSDSVKISGTFTVDGGFDLGQPLEITLGPDTFTVPGSAFIEKNGKYSCKSIASTSDGGLVSAKLDTVKCTFSFSIKNASLSGSGYVDFGLDVFGNTLTASEQTELPPAP